MNATRAHRRAKGESAAETAELLPQRHGGALLPCGKIGNRGGGRPRDEFRAMMAELASGDAVVAALRRILADPENPSYLRALEFVATRGYGAVSRDPGEAEEVRRLEVVVKRELPGSAYEETAAGLLGAGDKGGPDGDH